MATQDNEQPTFGIGAASRLTGVPVDTLRMWERRYNAVTPRRSPHNQRCYSRQDVARLALIKQLVDHGHAVSSVIHLPEEALRERLQLHADLNAAPPPRPVAAEARTRVLVYGDGLPFVVRNLATDMPALDIVGEHGVYADFERAALAERPEVLLVELPALQPRAAAQIRDLADRAAARRTVVVYGFAATAVLEQLAQQGVVALRAPVTASVLEEACRLPAAGFAAGPARNGDGIAPRRFDGEMLAAIAGAQTGLPCECPRHLVDLLFRLGAFEAYSAECEHRDAQDAALHAQVHRAAGRARALLETALAEVLEREGIELGADTQPAHNANRLG